MVLPFLRHDMGGKKSITKNFPGSLSKLSEQLLKVHQHRFDSLPVCTYSYKNNTLKILRYYSLLKFVFFLKRRVLFNVFYLLCMFVIKHFAYLKCAYL